MMPALSFSPPLRMAVAQAAGLLPGMLLCCAAGGLALGVANLAGGSAALLALLIGFAGSHYAARPQYAAGVNGSGKLLLKIGVALIGARISIPRLIETGPAIDLISIASLLFCLGSGLVIGRLLKLPLEQSLLGAGAVAICGASAALALATILPATQMRDRSAAFTVATVTLLSTGAMLLYPLIAIALNLHDRQAGAFFGASIHDLTQVVGAGSSVSPEALDVATITKLVRIACLMPVVSLGALILRRRGAIAGHQGAPMLPVPGFLVGFLVLTIASGLGLIRPALATMTGQLSTFLLVAATAALGFSTRMADMRACGWRPLALILIQTAVIALFALAATMIFVR